MSGKCAYRAALAAECIRHMDQRTSLQMLDELRSIRSILAQILERQTEIAQGMMALKQLAAVRSQELARLEGK